MQAAGNTAAQMAKHENDLQVVRKIFNAHKMFSATSGDNRGSFAQIKDYVMRSKPKCAASLAGMFKFALKFAGGSSGLFLESTETYVKQTSTSDKTIDSDNWDALSMDFVKGDEQCVFFRRALVKLMYTTSIKCTASDIKRCAKDMCLTFFVHVFLIFKFLFRSCVCVHYNK